MLKRKIAWQKYEDVREGQINSPILDMKAEEIWKNEVKPEEDLMGKAIAECIQSDIDRGVEPSFDY